MTTEYKIQGTPEEKELLEKIEELKKICYEYRIPFFLTYVNKSSEKATEYKSEALTALFLNQNLKDDKISDMVNVLNGFDVVPSSVAIELSFDDIEEE